MIIALGQGKSHRMAFLSKTKSVNYSNGIIWEVMKKANKANRPSDASTVIKLDVELDRLQLKGMRDFHNDVDGVMDMYGVTKSDGELYMQVAHKNQDALYAILEELKSNSPNLDKLCSNVSEIQRLAWA